MSDEPWARPPPRRRHPRPCSGCSPTRPATPPSTAPAGSEESEVTLSCDWSAVPAYVREYIQFPPFPADHLDNSLANLARLAARAG